jgi:hypothetical protein
VPAKRASAEQERWMTAIADYANTYQPVIRGGNPKAFQLHHVCGRSYIHNKTPIGHWFILPLPVELHDVNYSDNPLNVTFWPKNFTMKFGMQREIFDQMVKEMEKREYEVPPAEVLQAIADSKF